MDVVNVRSHHDARVSDWLLEVELLDKAELLSPYHMPRLFYRFGGVNRDGVPDIVCECPVCYAVVGRPFAVGASLQPPQGRIALAQPTLWGTMCPGCPRPVALLLVPDRVGVNLTAVAKANDGERVHWAGDTKTSFPSGAACGAPARPLGARAPGRVGYGVKEDGVVLVSTHGGGDADWAVTIWTAADTTTAHQITCPACREALR